MLGMRVKYIWEDKRWEWQILSEDGQKWERFESVTSKRIQNKIDLSRCARLPHWSEVCLLENYGIYNWECRY